jgi:benzoyl-CoA reductase/2-hydroxyglutaryl-CoA dehydratase subunit BcrC/BadD/HgdB
MSEQYREMWSKLGLNLEAHDALLGVLGKAYQDIFLAQQNRPEAMGYFDFVMTEVHGLRVKELNDARATGRKVIGSFCTFVPEELILAVDGISVGLCAGAEFAFDRAELLLPRNTCALIKSAFGFSLGKVCPYMESSDMIVGENTCDGKKKAYEEFGKLVKNLYVMDLPQMKSEAGRALLKTEYKKFMKALEDLSGKKITAEGLKAGIKTVNLKRKVMRRVVEARKADPAPISGLDALLANQLFFFDDPARFTGSVNKLADELEARAKSGKGAFAKGRTRVVVSGCPMAIPNWKLPMVIESAGAVVVGEESCVGERGARWMTSEDGNSVETLLDNIVDRYFKIDCAIFTPNQSRLDQVKKMVKDYNAKGVIHYCLQFCQPYQMETGNLVRELEKAGVHTLAIETDYRSEDAGQLKTRIEAFLEMIK